MPDKGLMSNFDLVTSGDLISAGDYQRGIRQPLHECLSLAYISAGRYQVKDFHPPPCVSPTLRRRSTLIHLRQPQEDVAYPLLLLPCQFSVEPIRRFGNRLLYASQPSVLVRLQPPPVPPLPQLQQC